MRQNAILLIIKSERVSWEFREIDGMRFLTKSFAPKIDVFIIKSERASWEFQEIDGMRFLTKSYAPKIDFTYHKIRTSQLGISGNRWNGFFN